MYREKTKLIIGFITYGKLTAKYLPYFLKSLKEQTCKDFKIIAIDNTEEQHNENREYIKKNYPEIEIEWAGENMGFAKAYNRMIRQAINLQAKYFLAVNPDMVFDCKMVKEITLVMESDEKIGAVAPKILKWEFGSNKRTNIVDSCGLYITKEYRFSDEHQGQEDNKNIINSYEVFGFTGAAVLFRLAALRDVAFHSGDNTEYFDELMFMYKEDCDLSYRLRLAGWKIMFVPKAVAYHHRTASPKGESNLAIALNRKRKDKQVKKWSYLNHWIMLLKFKELPVSFRVGIATWWYQAKSIVFILLFEQYLLRELVKLWKLRNQIRIRRKQLKKRVLIMEIEKFMK